MINATIKELSAALSTHQISSQELTTLFLNRIDRINPILNAMVTIDKEKTIAEAHIADKLREAGKAHVMTGIPYAVKDLFCQKDWRSACSSKMLDNFISPYDAHVIELCRQAGMVTLGRTNMDEFAMGSSNEKSYYGAVKNPWDKNAIPGGSSGGSAAAVAARLAPIALGTDTGGSIRQPASHCGITGIKPTYGVVSRFGMIAFASSLDQGGPMAKTAEDCAMMLNVMAGFDERDSTSLQREKEDYTRDLNKPIDSLRIGIPKEYFSDGLDTDVAHATQQAIAELVKLGAETVEISLPHTELSIPAYYVIAPAEASTNLSRYDGVRYGHRAKEYADLIDMYEKSRSQGFGEEVKRRILIGTYVLSHGYYNAYYLKAQKIRRLIAEDFRQAFTQCDIIVGPVAPTPAFDLNSKTEDPVQMYLSDIYTLSVNLAGLPGLSAPAGFASNGRPIGIQLIGNYFEEAKMLNIVYQLQQHTEWHTQQPTDILI